MEAALLFLDQALILGLSRLDSEELKAPLLYPQTTGCYALDISTSDIRRKDKSLILTTPSRPHARLGASSSLESQVPLGDWPKGAHPP